jgi:hypothetical protein
MRVQLVALLIAAVGVACTLPDTPSTSETTTGKPDKPAAPVQTDDVRTRALAAGLTPQQGEQLAAYRAGAVVPTPPDGWELVEFRDEPVDVLGVVYPGYTLDYRNRNGACFQFMAASEGLGDVFVIPPPHEDEADAPAIALFGPIPLGWSAPDEPSGDWGPGRVSTEWFGTDGLFFKLGSAAEDGCGVISSPEAQDLLASLRYLDPADDDTLPGHWEYPDMMQNAVDPARLSGPDPEAAARTTYVGDAQSTRVETIRNGHDRRVVLVTHQGLMDDSIQDQRFRITYVRDSEGLWSPQYAGQQQRCRSGRGHQDWGPERCV